MVPPAQRSERLGRCLAGRTTVARILEGFAVVEVALACGTTTPGEHA
jgi:hypothetical protein